MRIPLRIETELHGHSQLHIWNAMDAMTEIFSLVGRVNAIDRYVRGMGPDSPWVVVMASLESSVRFYQADTREFPYRITTDPYDAEDGKPMCFKVTTDEAQFKSLNSDFFKAITDDTHFKSLDSVSLLKYPRKDYYYFDTNITTDTPDIAIAHKLLIAIERGRAIFREP